MAYKATVIKGGKVSIPAACRKHLNLHNGEEVLFDIRENEVVMFPMKSFLATVRKKIAFFHPDTNSLVDKLIAQRRKEAENE